MQRGVNSRAHIREHVAALLAAGLDDTLEVGGERVAAVALVTEARLPPGDQTAHFTLGVIIRGLDGGIVNEPPGAGTAGTAGTGTAGTAACCRTVDAAGFGVRAFRANGCGRLAPPSAARPDHVDGTSGRVSRTGTGRSGAERAGSSAAGDRVASAAPAGSTDARAAASLVIGEDPTALRAASTAAKDAFIEAAQSS